MKRCTWPFNTDRTTYLYQEPASTTAISSCMNEHAEYRNDPLMDEPEGLDLADYLGILRRRLWYIILPAVVIFAVAATVALLLPPTYRSVATILIEQQQIPQDLVRSTVTSYADQRVQIISQRVMTTANLSQVIEKYGLYRDERKTRSMQSLVNEMRPKVGLNMVDAKVVDPRSGGAKTATIAFNLSFESESPRKAQQVANELVSLFLNENLRKRQEAARETSAFLAGEADRLAEQITALETKVAQFKGEHGENLPEMQGVNAQFLQRVEDQLERNEMEARLLEERIVFLEAELARTPRYGASEAAGSRSDTPTQRLAQLEMEYLQLAARTKANHPDRIILEREIRALRQQTGGLTAADLEDMLATARSALAERRQDFADSHPDVKAARNAVASLEQQLADARAGGAAAVASQLPDNPAYARVQNQITAARSELDFLREKKMKLVQDLSTYEERLKQAPKIERDYRLLTRDYDNAIAKYREIKAKQLEAELGESLEAERKAERFILIEPPVVPGKPIKPNRLVIVFMGLMFGVGGGMGLAVLRELMSPGMYGTKAIAAVTGAPPLAVVPYIETAEEGKAKRWRRALMIASLILLLGLALAAVHWFVRPLDNAFYQVLQRLELL